MPPQENPDTPPPKQRQRARRHTPSTSPATSSSESGGEDHADENADNITPPTPGEQSSPTTGPLPPHAPGHRAAVSPRTRPPPLPAAPVPARRNLPSSTLRRSSSLKMYLATIQLRQTQQKLEMAEFRQMLANAVTPVTPPQQPVITASPQLIEEPSPSTAPSASMAPIQFHLNNSPFNSSQNEQTHLKEQFSPVNGSSNASPQFNFHTPFTGRSQSLDNVSENYGQDKRCVKCSRQTRGGTQLPDTQLCICSTKV